MGHKGVYGHEFLEFEIRSDGRLRYANDSKYKSDVIIRKEIFLNNCIIQELKKILNESEILKLKYSLNYYIFREDDSQWPVPDKIGRQELEIKIGKQHINFTVKYS